ncbi:MAG: hypothetical protein JWR69_3610 [Pedosphaera sp.]|nr:hypothetical protein [Pedosphaera sp.]
MAHAKSAIQPLECQGCSRYKAGMSKVGDDRILTMIGGAK